MDNELNFSSRSYANVDYIKGNTDKGFRYQPLTPKTKDILKRIQKINPDGDYILMRNGRHLFGDTHRGNN